MFRRTLAVLAAALMFLTGTAVAATPAYASDCGGQVTDFVPNFGVSDWLIEAFINGDPQTGDVVVSYIGQAVVTTFVDPLSVGQGQYDHDGGSDTFIWYAVDLFNQGDRFTFLATAQTCNAGNTRVLAASGPVIQYNVGDVGVFYMTRVI